MYWYNPTTRTSERVEAPSTDEQAIEMLAGDPQSVTFVSEYARLRGSGMEIEVALIMVGHKLRLRHLGLSPRMRRLGQVPSRTIFSSALDLLVGGRHRWIR